MNNLYIIIGSGIAGLEAARAIRETDRDGIIHMFTKEHQLPYSRPMLTKTRLKSFEPDRWTIYPAEWFSEKNIHLHTDSAIDRIDSRLRHVHSRNRIYFYDRLILACGAESFIPPIDGAAGSDIFTIRRAEDIFEIKRRCRPGCKAVIIGGGVIGLEAAESLAGYGVCVTVLEAMPYLMTRQIDREISDIICDFLPEISIHTGADISSVNRNSKGHVTGVSLKDGRSFDCDFVIMACGVRAQTSVIPDTVMAPRAIEIDRFCRTSDKNIYAAGDCAQYMGINYALWSQAMAQGRTAGINAAADLCCPEKDRTPVPDFDTSLVINSPTLSLFALGDMGKQEGAEYRIEYYSQEDMPGNFYINPRQRRFFEKRYYIGSKLVGAAIVGNLTRMHTLRKEINGCEENSHE